MRKDTGRLQEQGQDTERRLRQQMRIYPQKLLKKPNILELKPEAKSATAGDA